MDGIAQVRSFNRTVTQRVGALDSHFLGRPRSLGASRLLFEIGANGCDVRQLRTRLDLDSGYLSRLLRGLERERLIRTAPSTRDARVREVTLTATGRRELGVLNRLSDQVARSVLHALNAAQRTALVTAMSSVERLFHASAVRLQVVNPRTRDARDCLEHYFAELALRFDAGFDPARGISATADELTPPRGYFILATLHAEPVGCGALKCHPDFGEIKRMWVVASSRGLGIGRRILERLEALARRRRIPVLRLETNKTLKEAQALYRSSGYREVPRFNDEPYAHHWFEKALE